jgi:transposase
MFIREIKKQNRASDQVYIYHRLMESVRTPKGPRQRIVLNLGTLELPREDWKALANRIEAIAGGQKQIDGVVPENIELLARKYAAELRHKQERNAPANAKNADAPVWERVDLHSVSSEECRTIGGEAVAHEAFTKLGFPEIFSTLDFSETHLKQAELLIVARALHPSSERETARWAKENSALGELIGADFRNLSNNSLYRMSDRIARNMRKIEEQLAENERRHFGLEEKIILYDLTNTYLTGAASRSEKLAGRGRSKQKRNDCPLVTLALVLDEDGFPKASRVFPGNASEPDTLEHMLKRLLWSRKGQRDLPFSKPTIVMDAGIAVQENIDLIQSKECHYICVSRTRPTEIPEGDLTLVNERAGRKVMAKRLDQTNEIFLYCESDGRKEKEASMRNRFQQNFEKDLKKISAALTKKGGIKKYDKVLQRIGRLRERYPMIARFYKIEVVRKGKLADAVTWTLEKNNEADMRFSGSYYLRSDRDDLNEKELWSLYNMLTRIEDSFRTMKSELGFRPVFHQKDERMEGHLFISVLAYHLIAFIHKKFSAAGMHYRWKTIRNAMATQARITVSMTNDKNERIHIRQTTEPEPFHLAAHKAMDLPPRPKEATHYRM